MDPAHQVPLYMVVPFALLLLGIAVLPLAAGHWWESNKNKGILAAVVAAPVLVWLFATGKAGHLLHTGEEYISFIVLLGSLYTISGGIFVDGDLRATPRINVTFLAIGALIASFVGTTGASMLLIRPLLRTNSERRHVVHTVVFFILIVSNCGGCLTPLGDPPLFMGYLRGVPFDWTFTLFPEWLGVNAALLVAYWFWDRHAIKTETRQALRLDLERYEPLKMTGGFNLLLLGGVVAAVAFITAPGTWWIRDGVMTLLALASLKFTAKEIRANNAFTWHPIEEVTVLFAGIFTAMIPALMYLEAHGPTLGVETPLQFFWFTGGLSAFLDNAPTYLTFTSVASGLAAQTTPGVTAADLRTLLATASGDSILRGISLGAVFMGAMTYIGNGPNFMVKAIAEASGLRMPSFFGYMRYSVLVLLPILAIMAFIIF